jgi:syntaxin 5
MCDRTQEFNQLVAKSNQAAGVQPSKRMSDAAKPSRTAFNEAASEIGRGIHRTSGVITKLTKLVKRQGLFDDPTEEINNLIFRIKQDIDALNTKCDSAQEYLNSQKRGSGEQQAAAYNSTVVDSLKTDLMSATKDFKNVLEVRSSKMKDLQQRKVGLTGNGMLSPLKQFNANQQGQKNTSNGEGGHKPGVSASPYGKMDPYAGGATSVTESPMHNRGQMQQQQQQLLLAPPQNAQYYDSREQAVTEVERTIGELGTLFKRLAGMINEQQELVDRIDDDVESAVANLDKGRDVIMKMHENASSNRGLYTKLAAIGAVFTVVFVVFLM